MNQPPPLPKSEARRHSKVVTIFKWIGIGFLTLIGIVIALAVTLASWPDSAPPDDSTIMPIFDEVSPDNPLAHFQAWVEANPLDKDDFRFEMLRDEVPWDPVESDELLEENKEVLRRFDELLATDISVWRWREGDALASFSAENDYFHSLMAVSKLMAIHSLQSANKGDSAGSAESAILLYRFGIGIQNAQGSMIHLMVGMTASAMGIRYLEKSAVANNMSSEQLKDLIANVAELEPQIANLQFALRTEYLSFKRLIDDMLAGKLEHTGMEGLDRVQAGLPFLQRNDTLRLCLDLTVPIDKALNQGWNKVDQAHEEQKHKLHNLRADLVRLFVSPNPVGKIIVTIGLPAYRTLAGKFFEEQSRHRQIMTLLAMRCYELEHRALPERLEELVPGYLAAIPEDPFTAQPMRWEPAKQVVYSLGGNQTDDGGDVAKTEANRKRPLDVGLKYWWANNRSAELKD